MCLIFYEIVQIWAHLLTIYHLLAALCSLATVTVFALAKKVYLNIALALAKEKKLATRERSNWKVQDYFHILWFYELKF